MLDTYLVVYHIENFRNSVLTNEYVYPLPLSEMWYSLGSKLNKRKTQESLCGPELTIVVPGF